MNIDKHSVTQAVGSWREGNNNMAASSTSKNVHLGRWMNGSHWANQIWQAAAYARVILHWNQPCDYWQIRSCVKRVETGTTSHKVQKEVKIHLQDPCH